MRTALSLFLLIELTCEAADSPKPEPSRPIRAFLAWLDAIGLKDTFVFKGEESRANSYALTLGAGDLENVVGQQDAKTLYTHLFAKLLTDVASKPETVELRVNVCEGGYCDPAIVRRTVKLNSKGITINNKTIRKPVGIACMLNFEAIRRYEKATMEAVNTASKGTPSPASAQTKVIMSADSIQNALTGKFSKRGASILVTGKTDSWLSMVVRNLQHEVILGNKYWERLQLLVFLEPAESANTSTARCRREIRRGTETT